MKKFYHNITTGNVNETDESDFLDDYTEGDIIYKSEAGNACIAPISETEMQEIINEIINNNEDDEDLL